MTTVRTFLPPPKGLEPWRDHHLLWPFAHANVCSALVGPTILDISSSPLTCLSLHWLLPLSMFSRLMQAAVCAGTPSHSVGERPAMVRVDHVVYPSYS